MGVSLRDLIDRRLGVRTFHGVNRATSSIGTSIATLVRQDANRVAFIVINLSPVNLFIGPIEAPSSTRGIQVGPNGGNFTAVWDEDFDLVGFEWRALAEAAASSVFVLEVLTLRDEPAA